MPLAQVQSGPVGGQPGAQRAGWAVGVAQCSRRNLHNQHNAVGSHRGAVGSQRSALGSQRISSGCSGIPAECIGIPADAALPQARRGVRKVQPAHFAQLAQSQWDPSGVQWDLSGRCREVHWDCVVFGIRCLYAYTDWTRGWGKKCSQCN